jgi:serine/threonine-protein kinase
VPAGFDAVIAEGMAKGPDQRYATTIELGNAARDAITVPIQRPTPIPPILPATQQASLPPTQRAGNRVTARPRALMAGSLTPAEPAPPPPPPTPTKAGGIDRRTTTTLVAGAIALVAVIAAVIGISAVGKHGPSGSSPTSSSLPTSSQRSYAAQVLPFTGLSNPSGLARRLPSCAQA